MKRIGALLIILMIATAHAAESGVRFPRFKFQPNKTYDIEIFHKNVISFRFNDAKGPRYDVVPVENQVLFKATLRTYTVTKNNVMPVKMRMNAFTTLIKHGKEMIPQEAAPRNDLEGQEFLGELDESGAIREVSASPASDSGAGEGSGMFELFSLIPLFPAGDYKTGADFYTDSQGRFFTAGAKPGAWVFKYSIASVDGDEVRIDSIDRSRFEMEKSGKEEPAAGSHGEAIYSLQRKIFSYVTLNAVSTSEPEREDLKGKGVVLNNRVFWIKINESK